MPLERQYDCDCEFLKMLTRRCDVDLTTAALEIARDAYPNLDFQATFDWCDARADELGGAVARAKSEGEVLAEFGRCLAHEHGISGHKQAYEHADGSYLHRVIEAKRGIPISLSILYIAVAERLGIDLKGVSAPMHFVCRYESVNGPLFIDAFDHGRVMTYKECKRWLAGMTGLPRDELRTALRPVNARTIIIRMLNNLKALYLQQKNWLASWRVQHRLTALQPASYQERRDLALISLYAERPGPAVDLLKSCLRTCPDKEREMLQEHLEQARSNVSRWN
jgi:regulator of sirC expression with transglutaminase-like and TPR domain